MKKTVGFALAVVAVLAVVITVVCLVVADRPEYALTQVMKDVKDSGLEGLQPHLTGDAKLVVEAVDAVADIPLVNTVVGALAQTEYMGVLKSNLEKVEWEVRDIMRGKENTDIVLGYNYEDRLLGSVRITMVKVEGEWKIDGLSDPKVETVNFK